MLQTSRAWSALHKRGLTSHHDDRGEAGALWQIRLKPTLGLNGVLGGKAFANSRSSLEEMKQGRWRSARMCILSARLRGPTRGSPARWAIRNLTIALRRLR